MITVKVPMSNGQLIDDMEAQHVYELKRMGVPLCGSTLIHGVETGSLSMSDTEEERTYVWQSVPAKVNKNAFSKRFRIMRFNTIGETWYEVQEWKWYWPMWDTWTKVIGPDMITTIQYKNLYIAREAVRFYQRSEKPRSVIIDHL